MPGMEQTGGKEKIKEKIKEINLKAIPNEIHKKRKV